MSPSPASQPATAARGPLGHGFRRLWLGSTTSAVGDGMWFAAIPLLAAMLSRDPRLVSLLEVAAGLPWLLFGLHAGAAADRWDRRRLMWCADLVRLCLTALLGILVLTNTATVAVVVVVVFMLASAGAFFASAAPALLPSLVHEQDLHRANARLSTSLTAGRDLVGPPAGAIMFAVVPWLPAMINAVSFGVSAWAVRGLPRPRCQAEPAGSQPRPSIHHGLADGLRWIRGNATMRVLVVAWATLAVATGSFLGVFVLVVLEVFALPATAFGLAMAVFAVGGVLGGVTSSISIARLGTQGAIRTAAVAATVAFLGIALSPVWVVAVGFLAVLGVATVVWSVAVLTVRQRITPAHLLGRVSGAVNMVTVGSTPLGAAVGGLVAKHFGLTAAVWLAAALAALAAVFVCVRSIHGGRAGS